MPIHFKVIYDGKRSDLEINFIKLLDLKIDLDKVIRFLLTTKYDREVITLEGLIYNFTLFRKSRNIITSIAKMTIIKKLTCVAYEDYEKYFLVVNSWIILSKLKSILHNHFYKIKNEYYMVADNEKFRLTFEAIMEVRIIFIIIAIIINIKDVFKIIKFMRVYYGKSKSTKSNI
ncbi:MAG TPA: hypothetical protein GXZ48_04855 [Acholeplasmataceae bacterium]|nr:hypothetical protein [Acholeplasmataceae bacterium]